MSILNTLVTLTEKIILWYLPSASRFRSVMLCSNLLTVYGKGKYNLLKELDQLKHSPTTKSVVVNNFNNNK